jgi:hypothetical protein
MVVLCWFLVSIVLYLKSWLEMREFICYDYCWLEMREFICYGYDGRIYFRHKDDKYTYGYVVFFFFLIKINL